MLNSMFFVWDGYFLICLKLSTELQDFSSKTLFTAVNITCCLNLNQVWLYLILSCISIISDVALFLFTLNKSSPFAFRLLMQLTFNLNITFHAPNKSIYSAIELKERIYFWLCKKKTIYYFNLCFIIISQFRVVPFFQFLW